MKDAFFGLENVSPHDESVELLASVYENEELLVLRSILDGEKIPYLIKERGSGGAVRLIAGYSVNVAASDVFVPKAAVERAKEVLKAYRSAEPIRDEGEEGTDDINSLTPEEEP